MKEWTEIISDARYFNLLVAATQTTTAEVEYRIPSTGGGVTLEYDGVYQIENRMGLDYPPQFIAASEVSAYATQDSSLDNIITHAADPAPAQRAGSVAFIWGKPFIEEGVLLGVEAYREDGFPAVVIAVGLSKHYHYGKLHRKRQHPAIKAEYLSALWYDKRGKNYRGNGPSAITFENYKMFWDDGVFKGHRWTDYTVGWTHRTLTTPDDEDTLGEFLQNLRGKTDLFAKEYFTNGEDEVCYMTDFA